LTLENYLEEKLDPNSILPGEVTLVEQVLEVAQSPTILMYIEGGRVSFVADSLQVLNNNEFVGGVIPSGIDPKMLEKLIQHSIDYGTYVAQNGGVGWLDIDWGILSDGTFVAFESNYRYTGNNHSLAVRQKLYGDRQIVSWSSDALKVPPDTTFARIYNYLRDQGLSWSAGCGDGIIITIPPAGGSMGYVALGRDLSRCRELHEAIEGHASNLKKRYLTRPVGQEVPMEANPS